MACNNPLKIVKNGVVHTFPCRWCMGCRIQRRTEWALRFRLESFSCYKKGFGSSFCTFTYNDDYYDGSVHLEHMSLMVKRLRYYLSQHNNGQFVKFRYYICSEYGENSTLRGHYHAIFFGLDSSFLSEFLRKSWRYGFVSVEPVCSAHFRYVLKYMDKQALSHKDKKQYIEKFGRNPTGAIMSKGIGVDYYNDHIDELIKNDGLLLDGSIRPLNPYYSKKYGLDNTQFIQNLKDSVSKQATRLGMSVAEYEVYSRYCNELSNVRSARSHGYVVSDKSLRQSKADWDTVLFRILRHGYDSVSSIVNQLIDNKK